MSRLRNIALAGAAALALSAAAASAQGLTNGPDGRQPNTMSSRTRSSGINSNMPSRAITNPNSGFYKDSGANLIHRHRHRRNYRHHYLRH